MSVHSVVTLWRQGQDTQAIALATKLPEFEVARIVARFMDDRHRQQAAHSARMARIAASCR